MLGKVFKDRYKLLSKLGAGVSSTVYEAEDLQSKQRVAIKVLNPELNYNTTFVQRFRRETRATQGINNPHIVKVLDWDEQDDTNFIVLELVRGKTLRQILDVTPYLDIIRAFRYTVQILEGVAEAHKAGIVHRDLKPANIMITENDVIKVMDFGIAKDAALPPLTRMGESIGTPYYMSPEQVLGDNVDERTDIYSIGAILYELLSGHPPFESASTHIIQNLHVQRKPNPLPELNPNIPLEVDALVQKALAKRPEDRYQTANIMINALNRYPGINNEISNNPAGFTTYAPPESTPTQFISPRGAQSPYPGAQSPVPPYAGAQSPYPGAQSPYPGAQSPVPPYPGAQSPVPPYSNPPMGYQPGMQPPYASPPAPQPAMLPVQPYQQRPGNYSPQPYQAIPNQTIVQPAAQSPNPSQSPGQFFYPGQQPGAQSPLPSGNQWNSAVATSGAPTQRRRGLVWLIIGVILLLIAGIAAIFITISSSSSNATSSNITTAVRVPTNTGLPTTAAATTTGAVTTAVVTTSINTVTVVVTAIPSPTVDPDSTTFQSAVEANKNQNWKQAITLLESLAAKNYKAQEVKDQLIIAYCSYGKDLAKNGDPSESVVNLENCLKLDPNNADSKPTYDRIKLYREGTIFATQKNWPAALSPLENLYSQDKNFRDVGPILFDAYRQYLTILTDAKNYTGGLALCDKAKKIDAGVDPSVIEPDCNRVLQLAFPPTPRPVAAPTATPIPQRCGNIVLRGSQNGAATTQGATGNSKISGQIFDRNSTPLPNVVVSVSYGSFYFTAVTNGNGVYEVGGLGTASWRVQIEAAPFITGRLDGVNIYVSGYSGSAGAANFVETPC